MPVIIDRFLVKAPREAVAFFHQDTCALRRLAPPLVYVQLHHVEPLAENSRSAFTLWFGPLPIHWLAVHSQVDFQHGFTDKQVRGPLKSWKHRHQWQAVDEGFTIMEERVEYEHHPGFRGLLTRFLFSPPLVKLMFAYRKRAIRQGAMKTN